MLQSHRLLKDKDDNLILANVICENGVILHVACAVPNKRILQSTLEVMGDGVVYTILVPPEIRELRHPQVYLKVGLEVLDVKAIAP